MIRGLKLFPILPYDLPDAALLQSSRRRADSLVFTPPRLMVVVGRGSDAEREVNAAAVLADDVPVYRRATGGCAVVLSPEMICVAFLIRHPEQQQSSHYFRRYNELLISALELQGVTGLALAGTSDIAFENRKIAGTSIYRNRDLVFFHAVINRAADVKLIQRYLSFPPRQPDYRGNRSHEEFVTSLRAAGCDLDIGRFSADVNRQFRERMSGAFCA